MAKDRSIPFFTFLILALACALGCDELAAPPAASSTSTTQQKNIAEEPEDDTEIDDTTEDDTEYEREVAKVGDGKKGRNYGGGVVTEPIRAMFRTEQRLVLLNIEQAMKLYKATNGYNPKSHEIFMKDIVEANEIQLPELPDGERYVYDPEKGELMVERPKR